jgi:hypothetical protein
MLAKLFADKSPGWVELERVGDDTVPAQIERDQRWRVVFRQPPEIDRITRRLMFSGNGLAVTMPSRGSRHANEDNKVIGIGRGDLGCSVIGARP